MSDTPTEGLFCLPKASPLQLAIEDMAEYVSRQNPDTSFGLFIHPQALDGLRRLHGVPAGQGIAIIGRPLLTDPNVPLGEIRARDAAGFPVFTAILPASEDVNV